MPIQVTIPNPNGADGQPVIFNSGGGNGGSPDYISYAGPPVVNPPALQNIIVDVNGQQWQYYQGAWH